MGGSSRPVACMYTALIDQTGIFIGKLDGMKGRCTSTLSNEAGDLYSIIRNIVSIRWSIYAGINVCPATTSAIINATSYPGIRPGFRHCLKICRHPQPRKCPFMIKRANSLKLNSSHFVVYSSTIWHTFVSVPRKCQEVSSAPP